MHPFLTIADRAARLAGKRIVQAFNKYDRFKVYRKEAHEPVTDLDVSVEKILIEHIHEAYPTHSILSEESGLIQRDEEYLWIIDPLDGTTNFVNGLRHFCISIAIQKQGVLSQGLIYDPLAQETFYVNRGQGGILERRRLAVSKNQTLQNTLIYMNRPPVTDSELANWSFVMNQLVQQSASIRLFGSAALGLAYVAAGRLDAFISMAPLKPWDMSAGALLVKEAGGSLLDIKGNNQYFENGQLIATNGLLDKALMKIIDKTP